MLQVEIVVVIYKVAFYPGIVEKPGIFTISTCLVL